MIVVDTSALMAIVLNQPEADACAEALGRDADILISGGTVAEALIVSARRNVGAQMASLIDGLGFEIGPVTGTSARNVADAYEKWGKGVHPAGLNFGDCFAYALAKERNCALLYVGNDFSETDIASALVRE
jgi:ribonuclease VapC